jgi:hypothetical protein
MDDFTMQGKGNLDTSDVLRQVPAALIYGVKKGAETPHFIDFPINLFVLELKCIEGCFFIRMIEFSLRFGYLHLGILQN